MKVQDFARKYYEQLGHTGGEYVHIAPIRSMLDGRFTSNMLRKVAYLMDRMRDDPDQPEGFGQGWYQEDEE